VGYTLLGKGIAKGGGGQGARPLQLKCFRFLSWFLAEIYLKCFILVTNFQKSLSAGGSPLPAPLNLQFWWAEVT